MSDVFHIVPATIKWSTTVALLLPLALVLVVVCAIAYSMLSSSRGSSFEVSPAGLRLRGDFYGRMIPATQLKTADVRRVDLDASEYHPTLRTNGIALPGYRAGWFRLRNGHKALLYVTDPASVVLVPTTAGYDVLLSVVDPERFVARMRNLTAPPPGAARSFP